MWPLPMALERIRISALCSSPVTGALYSAFRLRVAVLEHEGVGGAVPDRLEDEARVQAQSLGVGQALCRRGDAHPAQELVYEFYGLLVAPRTGCNSSKRSWGPPAITRRSLFPRLAEAPHHALA